MWNYGWGMGFFPFMPVIWIIIWVLIFVVIYRNYDKRHNHGREEQQSAEDILKERFAKGEINEKEFKEKMKVLREH